MGCENAKLFLRDPLYLGHYTRERLGMASGTARRLKFIERNMFDFPEIRGAYYAGEIGLTKVVQLLRIRHTRDLESWVERAKGVTVRRLEQEVQVVLRRVDLLESGLLKWRPGESAYTVLPEGEDLVRSMSALDEVACSTSASGGMTCSMSTSGGMACSTSASGEMARSTSAPSWTARDVAERYVTGCATTVTIRFAMDPEAAGFWQVCVKRCLKLFGAHLTQWECADRFIEAFFEVYDREDPLKYALNHKVFERDGWRCTVPGCRSRGRLHAHHVDLKSQGGPDEMSNLTSACSMHHHRAIHKKGVEVEGTAPDALIWRLGVREDGEALLTVGPGEKVLRRGNLRCGASRLNRENIHHGREAVAVE